VIPLVVAGNAPLAVVDAAGYLHRGDTRLEWWVLGDDQWHAPAATASLRQRSIDHTPVIETSIRVPGGDVMWRVGASVDGVVIECENRAAIPVALGLARVENATNTVHDLEVFPVTHGTTWRRALDNYNDRDVPDLDNVVKGWQALARHGASIVTNDPAIDDALAAARISLLVHQGTKPERSVAAAVNNGLEYLGHEDEASDLRVACKVKPQRKGLPLAAREVPAVVITPDDLALLADPVFAADTVAAVRSVLVDDDTKTIDILPGANETWRGRSIDVTDLPTRHGLLSFALRWHGDKPALLWDAPAPIRASALDPTFSSSQPNGEQLLAV
jgi:hypothetical protein